MSQKPTAHNPSNNGNHKLNKIMKLNKQKQTKQTKQTEKEKYKKNKTQKENTKNKKHKQAVKPSCAWILVSLGAPGMPPSWRTWAPRRGWRCAGPGARSLGEAEARKRERGPCFFCFFHFLLVPSPFFPFPTQKAWSKLKSELC